MHPNPIFRTSASPQDIDFLRERAFGTLAINGQEEPLTSHIPFLLSKDATGIELHLVRSNPIARASETKVPAVLTCLGPDGYVSPDWYGVDDQVPTWNYVAVRVKGTLERLPQDELHPMLDRLSAHFEEQLPKRPWTSAKMQDETMKRFLRMILPYRLSNLEIEGTWKLNQNKEAAARLAASDQISSGIGTELEHLAEMMRGLKES